VLNKYLFFVPVREVSNKPITTKPLFRFFFPRASPPSSRTSPLLSPPPCIVGQCPYDVVSGSQVFLSLLAWEVYAGWIPPVAVRLACCCPLFGRVNPRATWPESGMALEWAAASSTMYRQLVLRQDTQGRAQFGFQRARRT
jgi:hypothetical protein